ncbi:hypothetical protein N9341_00975 [Candidatus Pelagibacter sp.]|nr:hypothetical protein [Candidatus Pelagibacter sp.]
MNNKMNFKELLIVNNHSYKDKIDYYKEILSKKKFFISWFTKKALILTNGKIEILFNNFFKKI